ncbi:MAG: TVP38/TMEM64 family protein, partial [Candidatus Rokuibacteriota bacterium]
EGAILCFILYLIPGFPKDIVSYLFGISLMPFRVFAVVSTLGRLPGTWISSYFGAHVADHQYIWALIFIAIVAAIVLPLFHYRRWIIASVRRLDGRRRGKPLDEQRGAQ